MARKRYTTEQIIGLLREAEVRLGQGQAIGTVCRGFGISEQSYYRWRREYGGLKLDQAKRLKEVEQENSRLKRAAQKHTDYMQRRKCFDHECPGEPSVLRRLENVNYIVGGLRRWLYGENIAYGGSNYGTPRAIVRAWMHSPEHRHNILGSGFRQIGIGFARGTPPKPGGSGSTFTTDFGMRRH